MIWLVTLNVILGALWRRWHGMGQGPRWVRLVTSFALCWPLLFTGLPLWGSALIALAVTAYWIPGHDWTSKRALLMRYGPTPVALGYIVAHWAMTNDPRVARWSWFIDGTLALAELNAGAWVFGAVALVLL